VIGATFCSGIGAPEVAAPWVDWRLASEVEPFPRAVLQARHGYRTPDAHNQGEPLLWGDMTEVTPELLRSRGVPLPEIVVAGTPCQAFSVAGLRRGTEDPRGNLTLFFVGLVHDLAAARPDGRLAVLWENVPGVLSDKGNAFGAFLGGLVGADDALSPPDGGSWPDAGMVSGPRARVAWRVLDAQYFGVAQRRRRVFAVVDLGGAVDPAAVLFERQGVSGHPPPRGGAGEGTAHELAPSLTGSGRGVGRTGETRGQDPVVAVPSLAASLDASFGRLQGCSGQDANHGHSHLVAAFGGNNTSGPVDVATACNAHPSRHDFEPETFIAHSLRGEGFDASVQCITGDLTHTLTSEGFDASETGTGRGTPLVPVAIQDTRAMDKAQNGRGWNEDGSAYTLDGTGAQGVATPVAFHRTQDPIWSDDGSTHALGCGSKGGTGTVAVVCAHETGPGWWNVGDVSGTLRAEGENRPSRPSNVIAGTAETMYGVSHADAPKTDPAETLRALRQAVGEEAYSEWCLGVLAALRAPEVLRSDLHGSGVRRASDDGDSVGDDALPRPQDRAGWTVREVWEAGCVGCPPSGWQPGEQLARELGAHLPLLPHPRASASRFLQGMWQASEGLGPVREALSAVQEVWRPAAVQGQPAHSGWAVRRLVPEECEALQGFPRGFTDIPWRGKAHAPDGPRYKALGNSMAVPCIRWIMDRMRLSMEASR